MKKFYLKILVCLSLIAIMCCFTACSRNSRSKLNKILPDVDYDFVLINRQEIVKNGVHYDVEKLAYDIMKKKATDSPVHVNSHVVDENLYFTYTYSEKNSLFPTNKNNRKFDVALFKTNIETIETTCIYDFKDVKPLSISSKYPSVCSFIDDDFFLFTYNGELMLFDVDSENVIQTIPFYDAERAVCGEFEIESAVDNNYYVLHDLYYYIGGTLRYAEYRDGEIIDHTFTVDEDSVWHTDYDGEKHCASVNRIEKYIYNDRYKGGEYEYFNCFDLVTGQEVDAELIKNILKEDEERTESEREEQKTEDDRKCITVNGKEFYYKDGGSCVEIEDKDGNNLYSISSSYAERNNKKFIELFCVYFHVEDGGVMANTRGAYEFDNRLFVLFDRNIMMLGRTASMIFEFDFESGDLKYLTYVYGRFYIHSITQKNTV